MKPVINSSGRKLVDASNKIDHFKELPGSLRSLHPSGRFHAVEAGKRSYETTALKDHNIFAPPREQGLKKTRSMIASYVRAASREVGPPSLGRKRIDVPASRTNLVLTDRTVDTPKPRKPAQIPQFLRHDLLPEKKPNVTSSCVETSRVLVPSKQDAVSQPVHVRRVESRNSLVASMIKGVFPEESAYRQKRIRTTKPQFLAEAIPLRARTPTPRHPIVMQRGSQIFSSQPGACTYDFKFVAAHHSHTHPAFARAATPPPRQPTSILDIGNDSVKHFGRKQIVNRNVSGFSLA